MRTLEYKENMDCYKNNEFPARETGGGEDPNGRPISESAGKPLEKDTLSQEREQQVETWMTNIKAFIRNIDVSKL